MVKPAYKNNSNNLRGILSSVELPEINFNHRPQMRFMGANISRISNDTLIWTIFLSRLTKYNKYYYSV